MGARRLATLYLDLQMLESCRTAGLQARIFVFAGSAPLQWRIFVDHAAHERRWSGALQRGRLDDALSRRAAVAGPLTIFWWYLRLFCAASFRRPGLLIMSVGRPARIEEGLPQIVGSRQPVWMQYLA